MTRICVLIFGAALLLFISCKHESQLAKGPFNEVKIIFDNSRLVNNDTDVQVDTVLLNNQEDLKFINSMFNKMELASKSINTKLVNKSYYVQLRSNTGEYFLIYVSYLKYGGVIFSTYGSENYYNDDLNEYFYQKIISEGGQPNW